MRLLVIFLWFFFHGGRGGRTLQRVGGGWGWLGFIWKEREGDCLSLASEAGFPNHPPLSPFCLGAERQFRADPIKDLLRAVSPRKLTMARTWLPLHLTSSRVFHIPVGGSWNLLQKKKKKKKKWVLVGVRYFPLEV